MATAACTTAPPQLQTAAVCPKQPVNRRSFKEVEHLPSFTPLLRTFVIAVHREVVANDQRKQWLAWRVQQEQHAHRMGAAMSTCSASSDKSADSSPELIAAPAPALPTELAWTQVFESDGSSAMSVHDFVVRLCKYARCSPTVFVCTTVYVDRICMAAGLPLTSTTAHRVILTALVIAAKLHDDAFYGNNYYASIAGIPTAELNAMESTFLTAIDWDTFVKPELFARYQAASVPTTAAG